LVHEHSFICKKSFPPLDNPKLTIRRRSRADPTLLNDFEMAAEGTGDLPNSCRFHGLPGDDANKHLDKLLHVTQSIKVNEVTDDALCLYLFPHSLTHHATAWFDHLLRNSINTFEQMAKMFLALKAKMAKINKNLMRVLQVNQQVKAATPNCETCGGPHSFNDYPATVGQTLNIYAARVYQGKRCHSKNMQTKMTSLTNLNLELKNMFGQFMKMNTASSSGSGTLPGNTVTNPKEELKGITTRSETTYQGPTIPTTSSSLPSVVERKTEATKDTVHPINNGGTKDVQPSVIQTESPILNSKPVVAPIIELVVARLPEKLGDPGKFLIPCDFPEMAECLALADFGASLNLMPLSLWNKLSLPEPTPTLMTLKLADRSISRPIGVAEDVYVKVGKFHFPADFVVVDFDADPRVPLILERSFIKTERALIDVFKGELTLRVEVLGFSDVIASGNPTPYYDPIVSTSSSTLTPFGESDFLLEEVNAFLSLEDDATSLEVDQSYFNPEWDILILEAFLNNDPSLPPPNQGNYLPHVRKELKICKAKSDKSSIDEPSELELKDLPLHLEYVFLEGDDKLPVIIVNDLSIDDKIALITVLKSHKRAITWKLYDIKDIDPEFCTHKILMEKELEPVRMTKTS
nr:reverse transcriptase domain-containing protein [Tanacetum cinerariifolium]